MSRIIRSVSFFLFRPLLYYIDRNGYVKDVKHYMMQLLNFNVQVPSIYEGIKSSLAIVYVTSSVSYGSKDPLNPSQIKWKKWIGHALYRGCKGAISFTIKIVFPKNQFRYTYPYIFFCSIKFLFSKV